MLVEKEVTLRGGPENDYPTGDFVWPCMHCDAEFHGEQYDYVCYKCAKEEDEMIAPKSNYKGIILICLAVVAALVGILL